MPKYLGLAKFTPEGLKGVRAAGAASRRDIARAVAERMGGALEAYYFAFGEWDAYAIFDLPDDEAAAAISMAASESGAASAMIVKLLTPEQVDEAFTREVGYRAPGQ